MTLSKNQRRTGACRAAAAAILGLAGLTGALPGSSIASAAAVTKSCFTGCMSERKPTSDDYFKFSDDVRACRDQCDAAAIHKLRDGGLYDAYAACEAKPLSKEEFRELRAANSSWMSAFNIFTWDVRNIFPNKLLTEIEVRTQDMNLLNVSFVSQSVIPPGELGTFVVTDFFDGYPAVRYATRVVGAKACDLP